MNGDVIEVGSADEFSDDNNELELAAVDSELCQLQKKIEKLIAEKVYGMLCFIWVLVQLLALYFDFVGL